MKCLQVLCVADLWVGMSGGWLGGMVLVRFMGRSGDTCVWEERELNGGIGRFDGRNVVFRTLEQRLSIYI